MTIGIVGNYGNNNQGDEAILEGILVQLEEVFQIERKDIIVFSNNPDQTRSRYGVQTVNLFQRRKSDLMKLIATLNHNKPIIQKLDVLLIGGGGILMDLYRNNPIVYGMYGWMAKRTKTPSVIFGAGVGPINSPIGKKIIKFIGNTSELVTVRDPKSKEMLQSIGVHQPIHVISDPAFFVPSPKKHVGKNKVLQIGVTAVPYYNKKYWPTENKQKYRNYVDGMAHNLDKLLEENPTASVNFFSTKHPSDTDVTKEIKEKMNLKDRCTLCDEMLDHREILKFVNGQDIVIGTRLHSLILALVTDTPVMAVSYHHKVKDFMDTIGCDEYNIPIERLHERDDFYLNIYKKMNEDWASTLERFKTLASDMKHKEPKGMNLVKQLQVVSNSGK